MTFYMFYMFAFIFAAIQIYTVELYLYYYYSEITAKVKEVSFVKSLLPCIRSQRFHFIQVRLFIANRIKTIHKNDHNANAKNMQSIPENRILWGCNRLHVISVDRLVIYTVIISHPCICNGQYAIVNRVRVRRDYE